MRLRTDGVDGAAAGCGKGQCTKSFALWTVWQAKPTQRIVILGDLSALVPLSGFRFRLAEYSISGDAVQLVVVGTPGEQVTVHYLERGSRGWRIQEQKVHVGSHGRTVMSVFPSG